MIAMAVAGLAAAMGGGAYAATQAHGNLDQTLLNDVANRLHVTPAQLTDAFKQAMIDRINAAVAAGRLTRAQANRLIQRIQQSPRVPFALPGFRPRGPRFFLSAAASYLGLSPDQLRQQLGSGKSLAQIAQARGKSGAGLEQAITASVRSRLDQAVADGRITKSQEQRRLDRLSQALPKIVNRTPPAGAPGRPSWAHPGWGGPGGYGGAATDGVPPGDPGSASGPPPAGLT